MSKSQEFQNSQIEESRKKLIILSCVSMNEPSKIIDFQYYLHSGSEVEKTVKRIKNEVISENIEAWNDQVDNNEPCPYHDGYLDPEYEKHNNIQGNFLPLDDKEVFLIEGHTSYTFAYSITIKDISSGKTTPFVLFEF